MLLYEHMFKLQSVFYLDWIFNKRGVERWMIGRFDTRLKPLRGSIFNRSNFGLATFTSLHRLASSGFSLPDKSVVNIKKRENWKFSVFQLFELRKCRYHFRRLGVVIYGLKGTQVMIIITKNYSSSYNNYNHYMSIIAYISSILL